jgi:hypothetical protein
MYKSSSMTFVYKYLFTPVWGGVILIGIITSWNANDAFSYDWSRGVALLFGWAMIWMSIMMVRLKSVEATQDHLVIKSFRGQKTVDYKDIEWISQLAMINPVMISLKYFDKETGESKKILILPGMSSQMFNFNFLKELEMTTFIRERLTAFNPDYSKELEPSRWIPAGLMFITGLPIMLMVNFHFMNSI